MIVYLSVFGNPSVEGRERVTYPNLHFKWQIWHSIPHNRTFVASRHLSSLGCYCGVIKEAVVREQIVKKARTVPILSPQHQYIIRATTVAVGKPNLLEIRTDIRYQHIIRLVSLRLGNGR